MHPAWVSDFRLSDCYGLWTSDFSPYLWELYVSRMGYIERLGDNRIDEYRGAGLAPVYVVVEELNAMFSVMERDFELDAVDESPALAVVG